MDPNKRMRMDGGGGGSSTTGGRATELKMKTVVSVADVGRHLDLKSIREHSNQFIKWKKENEKIEVKVGDKFQGLTLTKQGADDKERITGQVFPSGKIVCFGAKTERSAREEVLQMVAAVRTIINATALPAPDAPKVQSYVASYNVGFDLQLEHLALDHEKDVTYEPEIYPNLIFKMPALKNVLAFISPKGGVALTAVFQDQLGDAQKYLYGILAKYSRSRYGGSRKS